MFINVIQQHISMSHQHRRDIGGLDLIRTSSIEVKSSIAIVCMDVRSKFELLVMRPLTLCLPPRSTQSSGTCRYLAAVRSYPERAKELEQSISIVR